MKKKEEKDKNPLHKEFGFFDNIQYILRRMIKEDKHFFIFIPLGMFCAAAMQYLWTFISKFVIDMITGESSPDKLMLLMFFFTALQIVSTMANTYFYTNGWRYIYVRFRMMNQKNAKVMALDYEYLENADVMDCYQKAGNACNDNSNGIEGMMRGIVNFLQVLTVAVVGFTIISTLSISLVLIIVAIAVLEFFISNHTNKITKERVWDPLATWWRKDYYMQSTTTDFGAAKDIRMFGLSDWLIKKYREIRMVRVCAQKTSNQYWFIAMNFMQLLELLSHIAVYGWLVASMLKGRLTIGNFSLYLASSATFFEHINNMLNELSGLFAKSRQVDDFRSFLSFDGGDKNISGRPVPKLEKYEFTFQNVSFRYPKAEQYALKNLNITVKAGERLAIVGLNGAGKTTLIKLLCRLYDVTEGAILIDGINIKDYATDEYRRLFAVVFQDFKLFAFTLKENVHLAEEMDDNRIAQVLEQLGLYEEAQKLDNGLDTMIFKSFDEHGTELSGGQQQKTAISRALYRNAPIVILDEPTAALDPVAEYEIYRQFHSLVGGRTAIYISHRLSSCKFCDKIAVFAQASIKEYGSHEELIHIPNGIYAEMFAAQAQYYTKEIDAV